MKSWDIVIIGGGIVGMSLALELRHHGADVLVLDRAEPGHEATYASAGMLACCDPRLPEPIQPVANASANLYPEFVRDLEDESGMRIGYRREGTIMFLSGEEEPLCETQHLSLDDLLKLEPRLTGATTGAAFLPEANVDPRALMAAAVKAAKHRGVHIASGAQVTEVETSNLGAVAVRTPKTRYPAAAIVNCAGAWAPQISAPHPTPTRPVKGQMLSVVCPTSFGPKGTPATPHFLIHAVRSPEVYLVPRTNGRVVIGSTLEEAGFDKRVDPDVIQRLHQAAASLLPDIAEARILENWAGLRPATPDNLPIIGATPTHGYFVATGHFRDGILLAPITARLMTQVIRGEEPEFDLAAFSPGRFGGA